MSITSIPVKLIGTDGNAFALLGRVRQALRKGGYDKKFIKEFIDEAILGDYKHLLATITNTSMWSKPHMPPQGIPWGGFSVSKRRGKQALKGSLGRR